MTANEALAVSGNSIALLGLPGYIGVRDDQVAAFLIYALVAGIGLAFVDRQTVPGFANMPGRGLVLHGIVRTLTVVFWGGIVYALAIALI